jgi:predicted  nucleic acid-binding Zn-ribbon protein
MTKTEERLEELSRLMATLTERLDNLRRDVETVTGRGHKAEEAGNAIAKTVAVIEERLNEMKKSVEEGGRRRWALLPPLLGGSVGATLALLGQLLVRRLIP